MAWRRSPGRAFESASTRRSDLLSGRVAEVHAEGDGSRANGCIRVGAQGLENTRPGVGHRHLTATAQGFFDSDQERETPGRSGGAAELVDQESE